MHSKRRLAQVEKWLEALELRKLGLSYRVIGDRIGCSQQHAQRLVEKALKRMLQEPADAVRKLEAERLDAMLTVAYTRATFGDPQSIYAVLQIMARRAKLLGLDAPPIAGMFGGVGTVNADGTPMTPQQAAQQVRQLVGALMPPDVPDGGT